MPFQSTRGPEGPRDTRTCLRTHAGRGFNPRAAPRGHATRAYRDAIRLECVSIHARPRGATRRRSPRGALALEVFQSTRGPEGPRDGIGQARRNAWDRFQSTRGPEGPRDRRRVDPGARIGVSIHARPRGATRHRSPRRSEPSRCFNPRAAPRGHATFCLCRGGWLGEVSIHARPRGATRRRTFDPEQPPILFQSTRGPEGPRDDAANVNRGAAMRFNPRAAPRGHATRAWCLGRYANRVSIHARPRGATRRNTSGGDNTAIGFQSTRGPEGPRDKPLSEET